MKDELVVNLEHSNRVRMITLAADLKKFVQKREEEILAKLVAESHQVAPPTYERLLTGIASIAALRSLLRDVERDQPAL